MNEKYKKQNLLAFAKEKQEEKQGYINHLKDTINELNYILNEYDNLNDKLYSYCIEYDYRPPFKGTNWYDIQEEILDQVMDKNPKIKEHFYTKRRAYKDLLQREYNELTILNYFVNNYRKEN